MKARHLSTFFIFFFGALGGLLFGFDTGIISGTSPLIESNFNLGTEQTGFIVSSVLIGSSIGVIDWIAIRPLWSETTPCAGIHSVSNWVEFIDVCSRLCFNGDCQNYFRLCRWISFRTHAGVPRRVSRCPSSWIIRNNVSINDYPGHFAGIRL